jgi:release factor glutamine methyltransferase
MILSGRRLENSSDSWRLDTELLLAHVLGKSREYLFAWPEYEIEETAQKRFNELLGRRSKGEPVAYLIGKKFFWDFELSVNSDVLIPRPETEFLVEKAIELAQLIEVSRFAEVNEVTGVARKSEASAIKLADLGTGSGAIAIALAKQSALWQVTAVDKSGAALSVAKNNARALNVANIEFLQGSWCQPLGAESYHLIAANPPYVEAGDSHLTQGSLPFEPQIALIADDQGLADIQKIIEQSRACLRNRGWLLIEHGFDQSGRVAQLLDEAGYVEIGSQADLAGIERVAFAQWVK